MLSGEELTAERIAAEVAELIARRRRRASTGAEPEVAYEMRYRGQAFELPVPGPTAPDPAELRRALRAPRTRSATATATPTARSSWSTSAWRWSSPAPEPRPGGRAGGPARETPRAGALRRRAGSRPRSCAASRRPATEAEGPAIFELPEATLVLPPGWRAEVDDAGTIVARSDGR